EVFTLPHIIHVDSSGFQWIPPLFRVQWKSSGLRVQSESSGFHWSPLDYRLNYNKHYNNISSPVESTGLDWTGL
ncbi:hypothetical protein K443DRAFT_41361, partial [Laccaria amethystina LaAM-08-1]